MIKQKNITKNQPKFSLQYNKMLNKKLVLYQNFKN